MALSHYSAIARMCLNVAEPHTPYGLMNHSTYEDPMTSTDATDSRLLLTGVPGLDDVLGGGLTPNRLYLLEGTPGAGKTTIALQYLMEGARLGESVLYVTLSETVEEIQGVARSHGWNLAGVHMREVLPSQDSLQPDEQNTMFHPSEVEFTETTLKILDDIEQLQPSRVVFDSLSELRLLAGSSVKYRRQILALKQFFATRQCTVILLDDTSALADDLHVRNVSHAVIKLEQLNPDYGNARRRLIVLKFRGQEFRGGYHDYKIVRGGMQVYPRLVAAEHLSTKTRARIPSGIGQLDELLGGGIEKGTSTLVVGAPGTGKSSIAVQFAMAAAQRGESAALFIFDESIDTLTTRSQGLGMTIQPFLDSGLIKVEQIDPAELSPGEFVHHIRQAVTRDKASVIVIDSLNGYLNAMPDERFLIIQLHELLTFLGQANVATLLIGAQHGLIGANMRTPVDASYLADAVVLMRYYEAEGEVRQAISVLKKRGGSHERTIRAFTMDSKGVHVGETLKNFRGVLTGVPVSAVDESHGQTT